ncbi:MAG TPA: hypothetical protein VD736_10435 [Nitrososphaera sp.]|nr:hypothetical protein [Nitrososphaera sp.]
MFIGLRRSILIGTAAAVAAFTVLLPSTVGLAFPVPYQLPVSISDIKVVDQQQDMTTLEGSVDLFNPGYGALAASKVEYDLFANGEFVGKGGRDDSDIPVNIQPQLLQRETTTLPTMVTIDSDSVTDLESSDIFWKASGTIKISSTFVIAQRDFTVYYQ